MILQVPVEYEDATWKIDGWFTYKSFCTQIASFLGRHLLAPFMVRRSPCVRGVPPLAPWPILPSALLAAPAAPPLLGSWRHAPLPVPRPAPQRRRAALQRRRTKQRGVGLRQQGGLQQRLHPWKINILNLKSGSLEDDFPFSLGWFVRFQSLLFPGVITMLSEVSFPTRVSLVLNAFYLSKKPSILLKGY